MIELLTNRFNNQSLNTIVWKVIDAIYPPFCCNCGVIGKEICTLCFEEIKKIQEKDICSFCGSIISPNGHCPKDQSHNNISFDQARSWGQYEGSLKSILKKIKYGNGFGLVKYLIDPLSEFINNWDITFDLITIVPLGLKRRESRGYNQATVLAKPIAFNLEKEFNSNALTRIRETRSQVGLNIQERKENVREAFHASENICSGKSILLFDDVTTTFSTLNECSKSLIRAGVKEIFCFTVGRAI